MSETRVNARDENVWNPPTIAGGESDGKAGRPSCRNPFPLSQEIPDIFIPPTQVGNAGGWRRRNENSGMTTRGRQRAAGATVIFTALPHSEHYVSDWTAGRFGGCDVDFVNANLETGAQECAVEMSEDLFAVLNAPLPVFTALPRSTVYFSSTGGGTLRAETEGESLSAGDSVLHMASVSFFAEAGTGWAVSLWSGGCAGTSGTLCATVAAFGAEVRAGVSREFLCLAFGGRVEEEGDGRICAGLDKSGTFCILDSAGDSAFPCRGLFKHLRRCNGEYDRPALNPFICDEARESGNARGMDCE